MQTDIPIKNFDNIPIEYLEKANTILSQLQYTTDDIRIKILARALYEAYVNHIL